MGNYYQSNNYTRNLRFYHQSEQASESALVETNSDETEKLSSCAPIVLNRTDEDSLSAQMLALYEVFYLVNYLQILVKLRIYKKIKK
jgi:hypothetical protein